MSGAAMLRALTPLGWLAAGATALALAAALLDGLGFRWDPLNLQQKRLGAAQAQARQAGAQATSEAEARRLETEGAAAQALRVDHYQHIATTAGRATAAAVAQARSADDADHPLDPRRAARLRDHDGRLCRLAADLDGCAASADPAADGGAALRPGDPAG